MEEQDDGGRGPQITVLTLFPELVRSYVSAGVIGRALRREIGRAHV